MRGLSLLLALICQAAFSLPEAQLQEAFHQTVFPYFQTSQPFLLRTSDGVNLAYRYFPAKEPMKGTVVIVSGRTEYMARYSELLYDLRDSGYAFFIYDHRGQGNSDRLLGDDRLKGYVTNYRDYIRDLGEFIDRVVRPLSGGSIYLLSHSMGGAIASAYMIENPGVVKAMFSSSPMIEIIAKSIPEGIAYIMAEGAIALGFGESYIPGGGPEDWQWRFENNCCTSSFARYTYNREMHLARPEWTLSSPTNQWVREAILLSRYVRDNAAKLVDPILLLAGTNDTVVSPHAIVEFSYRTPNGRSRTLEGARHEFFIEKDLYRNHAIRDMLRFFGQH